VSPFFEHDDLKKAGRALMILSLTYTLVDQCSEPFTHFSLLDVDIHVSNSEFLWLLFIAVHVYLLIFIYRAFQQEPITALRMLRSDVEGERIDIHQMLAGVHDPAISQLKNSGRPYPPTANKAERDKAVTAFNEELKRMQETRDSSLRRLRKWYKVRNSTDQAALIFFSYLLPAIFYVAGIWCSAGAHACPSFRAEIDVLAIVP